MGKTTIASMVLVLFVAAMPTGANAELIQSGSFVAEQGGVPHQDVPFGVRANILQNPGFETGSLAPWTTAGWTVSNVAPYTGVYCAVGVSNIWIRQDFTPIDVTTINSITNWEKQPSGIAFAAVDFIYSNDADYDEFLVAPGVDWTFQDMTSQLRGAGFLSAIRFWSYSGPGDQATWIDDVTIDTDSATPVESSSWGAVKNLYR